MCNSNAVPLCNPHGCGGAPRVTPGRDRLPFLNPRSAQALSCFPYTRYQVTIYDNLHMGDHLGVVVHYVNTATRHHKGGVGRQTRSMSPPSGADVEGPAK